MVVMMDTDEVGKLPLEVQRRLFVEAIVLAEDANPGDYGHEVAGWPEDLREHGRWVFYWTEEAAPDGQAVATEQRGLEYVFGLFAGGKDATKAG